MNAETVRESETDAMHMHAMPAMPIRIRLHDYIFDKPAMPIRIQLQDHISDSIPQLAPSTSSMHANLNYDSTRAPSDATTRAGRGKEEEQEDRNRNSDEDAAHRLRGHGGEPGDRTPPPAHPPAQPAPPHL